MPRFGIEASRLVYVDKDCTLHGFKAALMFRKLLGSAGLSLYYTPTADNYIFCIPRGLATTSSSSSTLYTPGLDHWYAPDHHCTVFRPSRCERTLGSVLRVGQAMTTDLARAWEADEEIRRRARDLKLATWLACCSQRVPRIRGQGGG